MRRLLPLLMTAALLLGGCGESRRAEKALEDTREQWRQAEEFSFTARVRAEFTDSVFECALAARCTEEETLVEVLEPEMIAGIRARLREDGDRLEYDGLILELGDSVSGELSPLAAMPIIAEAIVRGHISLLWRESLEGQEIWAAEVYVGEDEYAKLWFQGENFCPIHAELVSGGRCVIKCSIESFNGE